MRYMRPREKRSKKQSSDYPQMIFRIDQADKDALQNQIDKLVVMANRDAERRGVKKLRKNDVIVEALSIGLKTLEKNLLSSESK
jgi:hypothetical protein